MAGVGVTKSLLKKVGLHHLIASESHFCTLRIIWSAGLVTIPIMRAREHYL